MKGKWESAIAGEHTHIDDILTLSFHMLDTAFVIIPGNPGRRCY